jgi:pectin methylesterase-like acyl-CoA thioesterase
MKTRKVQSALAAVALIISAMPALSVGAAPVASPHVLQVGKWNGKQGAFSTIQSAVDAASSGDWILIASGTYHETGSDTDGVRITKSGLHLRGMDRNGVVIDGTRAGFGTCSPDPAAQLLGPNGAGRNGIELLSIKFLFHSA